MALLLISLVFYRTDLIVKQYYIWDTSAGQGSPSSKGYCGNSVSQKIRHAFFKLWGSNLSQFFKTYFKGVGLKLLASICMRDKSGVYSHGFFLLEASLPTLDESEDRLSTEAFLPWSDLVCSLPTQVLYSFSSACSFYHQGDVEMHQG